MKIENKMKFTAALAAALIATLCVRAVNSESTITNSVLTAAGSATNSKPSDVMTSLFGDPVIAKGKGVEVKQSQLDAEVARIKSTLAAQGRQYTEADIAGIQAKVLNGLMTKQLLLAMATPEDRTKGKEDFAKIELQLKTSAKLTDEQFNQKLNQQLKLMSISKEEWERQSIEQTTTLNVLKRELKINITDAEALAYYTNHPAEFEQPEKVHVRHILLLTLDPTTRAQISADQQKLKHKQMEDMLKRARNGEDFAKLASQYSEDPGSKDDGGELQPFARATADPYHAMAPEFEAAAFSLTNNQISDVVTTQFGYHIIKMIDKTPARKLALSDKPQGSDATVMEEIKNYLEQQKLAELAPPYLQKLITAAGVEIMDPNLKTLMAAQTNAPAAVPPAK
jgi:parvulin-like peptidyl-prolyl isomerase